MTDLVIKRSRNHTLRVLVVDGRASISISGGPAPTVEELNQVAAHLEHQRAENAANLMAKLEGRGK